MSDYSGESIIISQDQYDKAKPNILQNSYFNPNTSNLLVSVSFTRSLLSRPYQNNHHQFSQHRLFWLCAAVLSQLSLFHRLAVLQLPSARLKEELAQQELVYVRCCRVYIFLFTNPIQKWFSQSFYAALGGKIEYDYSQI